MLAFWSCISMVVLGYWCSILYPFLQRKEQE
jgi:hypothetical protein